MATRTKDPDALKTIGELSQELGVAQHILRYWESRFPQLKPMQRAGNRRYYRATDVALVRRIHHLLNEQGYTVKGVQKVLREGREPETGDVEMPAAPARLETREPATASLGPSGLDLSRLTALRNRLVEALEG
jgi:DNA-binding transcriptional MerR regulator